MKQTNTKSIPKPKKIIYQPEPNPCRMNENKNKNKNKNKNRNINKNKLTATMTKSNHPTNILVLRGKKKHPKRWKKSNFQEFLRKWIPCFLPVQKDGISYPQQGKRRKEWPLEMPKVYIYINI